MAEGSYVQIAQNGGVAPVATPFDKRLAEINTRVGHDDAGVRRGEMKARGLPKMEEAN